MKPNSPAFLITRWSVVIVAIFLAWIVFGVVLNPRWLTSEDQWNAILAAEALLGIFLLVIGLSIARRHSGLVESSNHESVGKVSWTSWIGFFVVLGFWLLLARPYWQAPRFIDDDLINLEWAHSWDETSSRIVKPFNEHLLVLTRLWAYCAVQSCSETSLPHALLAGLAFLFALANVLLFRLARREFQSDESAIVTCAFFSLTYVHHEVWWWFMAGQWLWQLVLLLAVLLILDSRKAHLGRLVLVFVLAVLAPFQFSIGLIIGPLAMMWIVCRWKTLRQWAWLPLLGSVIGLFVTMPLIRMGLSMDDPNKYNIKLKWFDIDLWLGLATSVRLLVDHLVLKNLGLRIGLANPALAALVFPILVAWVLAALAWFPRVVLGTPYLAMILLGYGLVIPFRSWMDYPQMSNWTARYQLFPHLGLVLFAVTVLDEWRRSRACLTPNSPALPVRSMIVAALVFAYQESTHAGWRWVCGPSP